MCRPCILPTRSPGMLHQKYLCYCSLLQAATQFLVTVARCEVDTSVSLHRSANHCKLIMCGRRLGDAHAFLLAFPASGADAVVIPNRKVCRGRKHFMAAVNRTERVEGGTLDHFYSDKRYHFERVAPSDQPLWFDEDVRCNCRLYCF